MRTENRSATINSSNLPPLISASSTPFSLSGTLGLEKLPPEITDDFYIYEITMATGDPNPMYLRLKADLDDFRQVYRQALQITESAHPSLSKLHIFQACPATVAVYIGLDVLPKTTFR